MANVSDLPKLHLHLRKQKHLMMSSGDLARILVTGGAGSSALPFVVN